MINTNYITVFNLLITEHLKDNNVNEFLCMNSVQYSDYMKNFMSEYFYQVATVSGLNGVTYIINMLNVYSIEHESGNGIKIEFNEGNDLIIEFRNEITYNYEKKYLKYIYEANHFEEIYGLRNKLYVAPTFTNINSCYSTIALANADATAGDVIYILSGEYSESIVLKSGVIYYFQDGANVTYNGVVMNLEVSTENIIFGKVFGRGKFISSSSEVFTVALPIANQLDVYENDYMISTFIECKYIEHEGRCILLSDTILKCKEIYNSSSSYAVWDTDYGVPVVYGIAILDCQYINCPSIELTFHQDAGNFLYVYKNFYITAGTNSGVILFGESGGNIETLFHNVIIENIGDGSILSGTTSNIFDYGFYNCVLNQSAGDYFHGTLAGGFNVNLYSYNYFDKTYNSAYATVTSYNSADNLKLTA